MAVNSLTIRRLLERTISGEVRIPAFQREYVWEPDRVQFLMDSIYKGYPIGTLLFWRTRNQLTHDRDLGPYQLPMPTAEYPIDYVLDGQQRLTSIFATFQTTLSQREDPQKKWVDIYFDLRATEGVQDSQFVALDPSQVDDGRHVPLKVLFNVAAYGRLVRTFSDEDAAKIDILQNRFVEAQVPIETVETEDQSKIAIIFERVNRAGVPLDTYQLLSAWTWNTEFDLRVKFDNLADELDEVGFKDINDDPNLLLRSCAAVIANDASARSIIALNGDEVRRRFVEFEQGVRGAVEFLRRRCHVASLKILPYHSMIVPLVRFFATTNPAGFHPNSMQSENLIRWFWRSCFSRRYSNSVDTALGQDIDAVIKLRSGDDSGFARAVPIVDPSFFTDNIFSLNSVNTKTFILLLAHSRPLSFWSAQPVDLDNVLLSCNRTEFHHIFPKAYLAGIGVYGRDRQFVLANFAFLSQTDNRRIRDRAPHVYEADIPIADRETILRSAFIPQDGLRSTYSDFIAARAVLLAEKATELCT
ncbi:MAG: DUF262 domain-containing protein [Gluconacetobacter sp.]